MTINSQPRTLSRQFLSAPAQLFALLLLIAASLAASYGTLTAAESVRLSKATIEKLGREYGYRAKRRLTKWQNLLDELPNEFEANKVKEVNNFFNTIPFKSDERHWGQSDYWATPVELLITNAGDCEDYSIAKYYTLRELGVQDEKLSIAYVKALDYNQAHMVLTYYTHENAMPLVLDNLNKRILPADKRADLQYVYSFNGENLWLSKKGKRAVIVGTSDRLDKWVALQSRVEVTGS